LHLAPLSLLIVCELLLFAAQRLTPLPAWLMLAAMAACAAAVAALATRLHRREMKALGRLAGEVAELHQQVVEGERRYQELLKGTGRRNRELSLLNDILTGINRGPQLEGVRAGTLAEIVELVQAGGGVLHLVEVAGAPPESSVSRRVSPELSGAIARRIAAGLDRFREVAVEDDPAADQLLKEAYAEGWRTLTSIPLTANGHLVGVVSLLHETPHAYAAEDLRFLATVGKQLGSVIEKTRLFAELSWKSAELLRSHRLLEKTSHNLSVSEIKLKQNLALVEKAHTDLSRLDRMKTQFLGMVSHEFNTPLTSILAGTEYLLQRDSGNQEVREVLAIVRDGGTRLKELVADLLKLIRLEAKGGAELETSAVNLKRFLELLICRLKPQLDLRRQTVTLSGLDGLPHFDGDGSYLERLFDELLINAMKYSSDGGEIEVTGRVVDRLALWERRETLARFNPDFLGRSGDRCYLQVRHRDPLRGAAGDLRDLLRGRGHPASFQRRGRARGEGRGTRAGAGQGDGRGARRHGLGGERAGEFLLPAPPPGAGGEPGHAFLTEFRLNAYCRLCYVWWNS